MAKGEFRFPTCSWYEHPGTKFKLSEVIIFRGGLIHVDIFLFLFVFLLHSENAQKFFLYLIIMVLLIKQELLQRDTNNLQKIAMQSNKSNKKSAGMLHSET